MAGDIDFLRELEAFLAELDWVEVTYARIAQDGAVDLGVVTDQRARLHVDLVARFGAGRVNVAAQRPGGTFRHNDRRDRHPDVPRYREIDRLEQAAQAAFVESEWAGVVDVGDGNWELLVASPGLEERVEHVARNADLAGRVTARLVSRSYADLDRLMRWAQAELPRMLNRTCHRWSIDTAENAIRVAISEPAVDPDDASRLPDGIRIVPGQPMAWAV